MTEQNKLVELALDHKPCEVCESAGCVLARYILRDAGYVVVDRVKGVAVWELKP